MKSKRILMTMISLMVILSTVLVACGSGSAQPADSGKTKVGLSFSDFATERWKNEEVLMRGLLEGKGYEVISAEANHDVKLQNDQIDNMVSQGVKGLLVVAEDGDAVVTSVDKAADAGVKVIALGCSRKRTRSRCPTRWLPHRQQCHPLHQGSNRSPSTLR